MTSRRLFSFICALTIVMAYLPVGQASAQGSGVQGNGQSEEPTVSADGRYVAFWSDATNLVPDDTNAKRDVFIRDRSAAVTQRISVSSSGAEGNDWSEHPHISPAGSHVSFESVATNLVSGDSNAAEDVFVRNLASGITTRISVSSSGTQGNAKSEHPHMSSDGRYVVFHSDATNLVGSDTNAASDVFLRDRTSGTTTRVSTTSSGGEASGGGSYDPVISPDGRYVGFHSHATNLVSGDTNTRADIFVKDLSSGTVIRASVHSSENEGDGRSDFAWLSDEANHITFESDATDLVSSDTNNATDVFVRHRLDTTTKRASVSSSEEQGDGNSSLPSISSDGYYVAFRSLAQNLVSGDTNGESDIFVRDRRTDTTTRVSVSSTGEQSNDGAGVGMVSGGGGYVVFYSHATNLVPEDANGFSDVFIHDLNAGTTSLVSVASDNRPPVISLSVTPEEGDTNTTFTADLSGSYDPDGDALSYQIDWGDGTSIASRTATHSYASPGDYTVTGVVADPYGATATATKSVRVCTASAAGNCVAPPPTGGNEPCHPESQENCSSVESHTGTCLDPEFCDPAVDEDPCSNPEVYCESDTEAPNLCSIDAFSCLSGVDSVAALKNTPPRQLLVVSLNAHMGPFCRPRPSHPDNGTGICRGSIADDGGTPNDPDDDEFKADLTAQERQRNIAVRLRALVDKSSDDGMSAYVPDVILLQEAWKFVPGNPVNDHPSNNDHRRIADQMENVFGGDWGAIGQSSSQERKVDVRPDLFEGHDLKKLYRGETAIIYRKRTVTLRFKAKVTNTWDPSLICNPADRSVQDEDADGYPDCDYAEQRRQLIAGFRKKAPIGKTGAFATVASVHMLNDNAFSDQAKEQGIPQALRVGWAEQIDDKMKKVSEAKGFNPDLFAIGGDFNEGRCRGTRVDPNKRETAVCSSNGQRQTAYWTALINRRYVDAIFNRHGNATTKDRDASISLTRQYEDGLNFIDEKVEQRHRGLRIDLIFARFISQGSYLRASHDLTCGERPSQNLYNCDEFVVEPIDGKRYQVPTNPDRYSDHRLLWGHIHELPEPK